MYTVKKKFLNSEVCNLVRNYAYINTTHCQSPKVFRPDENKNTASFSNSFYCEGVGLSLLIHHKKDAEEVFKKKLNPTYSWLQVYTYSDLMEPHCDRPECEYSMSILIDKDWDWKFVAGDEKISLDAGDVVFYEGTKLKHGRDGRFLGDRQVSLFLHYVDANGPYKDLIADKDSGRKYVDQPFLNLG